MWFEEKRKIHNFENSGEFGNGHRRIKTSEPARQSIFICSLKFKLSRNSTAFKKVEFQITVSQPGAPMMGPLKLNETNGFSADVTHHSNSKQNLDEIAIKLYEAADCFETKQLEEICLERIQANLSVENALETYKWAYNSDYDWLN
jgi:hypothetical protein